MTYEEFKDRVVDAIKDYLPDQYMDADVKINPVIKNNETLDGLIITKPNQNVSPTIYLNSFYENYLNGKDMEQILEDIGNLRVSHEVPDLLDNLGIRADDMTDYEKIKDRLIAHVVGIKGNVDLIDSRPHIIKEDMAIMYKIELNDEMTVPVTNALFSGYNIPLDEFHDKAMENIKDRITITSMSETIKEMMGMEMGMETIDIPPEKDMIIISNEGKVNGAIGIFDKETMDLMAERYGNFILMPSSVHESLIVPEAAGLSVEDAREMVRDVNATQVEPQDRLTDNVYRYDTKSHELKLVREETELYRDRNIVVKEDDISLHVVNETEKEMAVYGEKVAKTLDLNPSDAVMVLYPEEEISWDTNQGGFTKEIVDAIRDDVSNNKLSSSPLDEGPQRNIKKDEQALALA